MLYRSQYAVLKAEIMEQKYIKIADKKKIKKYYELAHNSSFHKARKEFNHINVFLESVTDENDKKMFMDFIK